MSETLRLAALLVVLFSVGARSGVCLVGSRGWSPSSVVCTSFVVGTLVGACASVEWLGSSLAGLVAASIAFGVCCGLSFASDVSDAQPSPHRGGGS